MNSQGGGIAVYLEVAALLTISAMTVMAVRSALRPLKSGDVRRSMPVRVTLAAAGPDARDGLVFAYRRAVELPSQPAPPPSLAEMETLEMPAAPPIEPAHFRKPVDAGSFSRALLPEWSDDMLPPAPPLFARTAPRAAPKASGGVGRCTVTGFTAPCSPVPVYVIESPDMTPAETASLEKTLLSRGAAPSNAVIREVRELTPPRR